MKGQCEAAGGGFFPYRRSIIRATTPARIASVPNTQTSSTSVLMSGIRANIATPELRFCKNRMRNGRGKVPSGWEV